MSDRIHQRHAFEPVVRQSGGTSTERYLSRLCDRTFLSLWSYPAVFRDQGKPGGDGKEVCDLLVVFGDDVIIFSDKECSIPNSGNLDKDWSRWFRRAVQHSAEQVWGAERWIRTFPDRLFLDRACTQRLPLAIDPTRVRFHRMVVAHDAAQRCRDVLGGSGSLAILAALKGKCHYEGPLPFNASRLASDSSLGRFGCEGTRYPFAVGDIDPDRGFVHVLNDASLDVVLGTLDTAADFIHYLTKKEAAIRSGSFLFAGGEEDLLGYYFQECDEGGEHDFMFPADTNRVMCIPEGEWAAFTASEQWSTFKSANKVSYLWDQMIEVFNGGILDGTSGAYPQAALP